MVAGDRLRTATRDDARRDLVVFEYPLDPALESWQSLREGDQITIIKSSWQNTAPSVAYPGKLLQRCENGWYVFEAIWTLPDLDEGGVLFETGAKLLEYFSPDHRFNVFHVFGRDGTSHGYYGNVIAPPTLEKIDADGYRLTWEDHWLDVLLLPDSRMELLDEDELPESLPTDLRCTIFEARDALVAALRSGLFG